ncbi:YegP family protein [Pseudonocardia acaciae]|uniref:YegP family protein n=1 Tax=Pseudonocardia acaciae TaxID=551276 RepID=UPI0009FD8E27|nr:YegP family protein [Pseudonocardia acaciae]
METESSQDKNKLYALCLELLSNVHGSDDPAWLHRAASETVAAVERTRSRSEYLYTARRRPDDTPSLKAQLEIDKASVGLLHSRAARTIARRYEAGRSVQDLANEYSVEEADIRNAITGAGFRLEPTDLHPAASTHPGAQGTGSGGKFEVYKDRAGKYRFRLRAFNGQILAAAGEAYETRDAAIIAITSVRDAVKDPNIHIPEGPSKDKGTRVKVGRFEIYIDRADRYRFRLKAPDGQVLATGEAFESLRMIRRCIDSIIMSANDAELKDG